MINRQTALPIPALSSALLALDGVIRVFLLAGGFRQLSPAAAAAALASHFCLALTASPRAFAQGSDDQAVKAHARDPPSPSPSTGYAEVDRISKRLAAGLTLFLAQRTALEAGEPVGLDPPATSLPSIP